MLKKKIIASSIPLAISLDEAHQLILLPGHFECKFVLPFDCNEMQSDASVNATLLLPRDKKAEFCLQLTSDSQHDAEDQPIVLAGAGYAAI